MKSINGVIILSVVVLSLLASIMFTREVPPPEFKLQVEIFEPTTEDPYKNVISNKF